MVNNSLGWMSQIKHNVSLSDYYKGKNYYRNYIEYFGSSETAIGFRHNFTVESERTLNKYKCVININKNKTINNLYCNCLQFNSNHSCKHVAACLINYEEELHGFDEFQDEVDITDLIFDKFKESLTVGPKKKVNLDIELVSEYNEREQAYNIEVKPRIGVNKLYSLNTTKLNGIYNSIKTESNYSLGKEFNFSVNNNYFSDEDMIILDFLKNTETKKNYSYYYYTDTSNNRFTYDNSTINKLFKLLEGRKFGLNNRIVNSYKKEFPIITLLSNENDKYKLKFNLDDDFIILTDDYEYIYKDNTIYYLTKKQRDLLSTLYQNELDLLIFDKERVDIFSKSVLPIIKDTIKIDSTVDIIFSKDPKVKLYLDLYYNSIICTPKFVYNNELVDYYDKSTKVLRNEEFEKGVISDLFYYKFTLDNNRLLITDTNDIGDFLEFSLDELSSKYETFTSEKISNTNLIKNNSITSTFSIGKDNILSCSFDYGNIDNSEIDDVLEALRSKKKYYRLKNGDYLNIDNDSNLKELEKLSNDISLSESDLENGIGYISKYRAIYLDSIKSNNYSIIKTDNLFNNLVTKFKTYKDSDLSLSKEDVALLREYQINGAKWLYNIHNTGFGGILADEMGLGKSIQTIYFIKELLKDDSSSLFLIVAPTSLAYNWEREFIKFGSNIKFQVIAGTRNARRSFLNNIGNTNVIITTYGLLREDFEYYSNLDFKSVIIDEAQNIKNPNAQLTKTVKKIKSESKFALTGTPLENSVIELWSIFDFIMPGFLSSLAKFKARYKIKEFDQTTNELLDGLNKEIAPFILRRKKSDVVTELPEKLENNIYIDLNDKQKELYLAELSNVEKIVDNAMKDGGINKVRFIFLQLMTKLRQICIDPRIVYENYVGGSGKIDTLIRTIKEVTDNKHKVLLFTSFKTALDLVQKELDKNEISSYEIDGSVSSKKRMELVDKFNTDDTKVFLIMLKAGGTGLNLTSADIVIHLDLWWNPQAENQATDRAHRIGQTKKVEVIKLITKGTIEEKILDLQQKKKILSDKLIESDSRDSNILSTLTEEDLRNLLAYENSD